MTDTTTTDTIDQEFADVDWSAAEGGDVAREEAKSMGGSFGYRTTYLDQIVKGDAAAKAKKEDRVYLRYLTDFQAIPEDGVQAWITVNTHTAVKTKDKPASWPKDRKWPERMSAVCRKSKVFAAKFGGECWIDDNRENEYKPGKPHPAPARTWALAVRRTPIIGDGTPEMGGPRKKGRTIGFDDYLVEVPVRDENGEMIKDDKDEYVTEKVPQYVIVRQAFSNYFQALDNSAREYGTALDRDWLVQRDGDDKDTQWNHTAMDPMKIKDEDSGEEIEFDMRDPQLREDFYGDAPSLTRIISEQVSTEYFNKWFIPQDDDDVPAEDGDVAAPDSAASKEPDKAAAEGMKERLRRRQTARARA